MGSLNKNHGVVQGVDISLKELSSQVQVQDRRDLGKMKNAN